MSVAFSPDNKYLASGGLDGLVNIFDVEVSLCLGRQNIGEPLCPALFAARGAGGVLIVVLAAVARPLSSRPYKAGTERRVLTGPGPSHRNRGNAVILDYSNDGALASVCDDIY
ncbi:unnamed protein product, partial [Ectocarpus sp. 12 AP-2014]